MSNLQQPPDYVKHDSGWQTTTDATPHRGWHPAARIVVYTRELTPEERADETARICTYLGQNAGERDSPSARNYPADLTHLVKQFSAEDTAGLLHRYRAYCDSGD